MMQNSLDMIDDIQVVTCNNEIIDVNKNSSETTLSLMYKQRMINMALFEIIGNKNSGKFVKPLLTRLF